MSTTLALAIDDNDTSLKLATSAGMPWLTGSPLAKPYYIQVGGDAMKVTTMVEDTPAFIAAGAAVHGNNASVSPALPAGITVDTAQALIVAAAIRNSGTGTVNLPANWTDLANFGNLRVFGRYYTTGVTAPTVTFTNGVANADTTAQMAAFSGLSLALDDGTYAATAVSPQTQLNGSAQDVAFPALTIRRAKCGCILVIWKQDDWTSVATPAAFDAEIGEPDTTTGDDQGIAWYYDLQSTATDIAAGTAVVTGGAAAISRAIVFALRPLQTATVTRGINSSATSHAVGDAVRSWRMGVNAL